MQIKIKQKIYKEVNATQININAKTSDLFSCVIYDEQGNVLKEYDGYVPSFIPGHYGDYLDLEIDIDTGKILNWPKINPKELANFISENDDNDD